MHAFISKYANNLEGKSEILFVYEYYDRSKANYIYNNECMRSLVALFDNLISVNCIFANLGPFNSLLSLKTIAEYSSSQRQIYQLYAEELKNIPFENYEDISILHTNTKTHLIFLKYLKSYRKTLKINCILFDHGLGDFMNQYQSPLRFLPNYKILIHRFLYMLANIVLYSPIVRQPKEYASILAPAALKLFTHAIIYDLDATSIIRPIESALGSLHLNSSTDLQVNTNRFVCYILMCDFGYLTNYSFDTRQALLYYQQIFSLIIDHIRQDGIHHGDIILKPKPDLSLDNNIICAELRKQTPPSFNLQLCREDLSQLPAEFLPSIFPVDRIYANLSSSLLYMSRLYPDIKYYSYHDTAISLMTTISGQRSEPQAFTSKLLYGDLRDILLPFLPSRI